MRDPLSARLRDLQAAVEAEDSSALADFWAEVEELGTPLIEPDGAGFCHVTFLWRDADTRSVDVIQDWGADGIREHAMSRLPGTDVWYATRRMPSDTRTTYQLAPEPLPPELGSFPLITDPLNPNRFSPFFDESGFQIWFSSLVLPDAPAQPWIEAAAPAGSVTLYTPFEDGRRIWVYLPPAAEPPYSLLVAFDGRLAKDILGLPRMLDARLAEGAIAPSASRAAGG